MYLVRRDSKPACTLGFICRFVCDCGQVCVCVERVGVCKIVELFPCRLSFHNRLLSLACTIVFIINSFVCFQPACAFEPRLFPLGTSML